MALLDAPPAGWGELLLADPSAGPAHRPDVVDALVATQPGWTARFVAVEERGVLVGGAAFVIARRAGFHWLHALPFLLPGAALARPGAHGVVDARIAETLGGLQRAVSVVGGEWVLYRPEGPAVERASLAPVAGETLVQEAAVLDLAAGVDRLWRGLDVETRRAVRHARARGLTVADEPGALEACYALHLAQARAWGTRPLPLELSRRLLDARAPAPLGPAARLLTVRGARGALLVGMFFLEHPHETLAWWSGARPAARGSGATALVMWSAAEAAAARGVARLNLGGGGGRAGISAFKATLGARPVSFPVRWLDAPERRGPARWMARLQQRIRGGRFRGGTP